MAIWRGQLDSFDGSELPATLRPCEFGYGIGYGYGASAGGGGPAKVLASASIRAQVCGTRAAFGANPVETCRYRDFPLVSGTDPSFEFFNGYINVAPAANGLTEVAVGNANTIRARYLIGGPDKSLSQNAATKYPFAWTKAYAGTAGYIWKLDGTTPSGAEITAAIGAGTLGVDVGGVTGTIRMPDGWRVRADELTGLSLTARAACYFELQMIGVTGQFFPSGGTQLRAGFSEGYRSSASAATDWDNSNWAGSTVNVARMCPTLITLSAPAGTMTMGIGGDSTTIEVRDAAFGATTFTGDNDGCMGWARRACNLNSIPFVMTAYPGDKASVIIASINNNGGAGFAQRGLCFRICDRGLSGMGHNDRSLSWASWQSTYRAYWTLLRSWMKPGAKVGQADCLPLTSSTDDWLTTTFQTNTAGAVEYSSPGINEFIQAGVFDVPSGDPDFGISINTALYTWAAAQGYTLPPSPYRLWPANGGTVTAHTAVNYDSTHPMGPTHGGIAADRAAQILAMMA